MTYHKMQATPKEQGDPPSQNTLWCTGSRQHSANTGSLNLPHEPLQGMLSPTLDFGARWLSQGRHPELGVGQTSQRPCKPQHYYVVTVTSRASPTAFLTWGQAEHPGQPALDLHSRKAAQARVTPQDPAPGACPDCYRRVLGGCPHTARGLVEVSRERAVVAGLEEGQRQLRCQCVL